MFCGTRYDYHLSTIGQHRVAHIAVRGQSRTRSFRFFSKDSGGQTNAIDTAAGGGLH